MTGRGILRVLYVSTAGALTGVSAWLTCAAIGVTVANPVFSFGALGVSCAVLFALHTEAEEWAGPAD